MPAIDQKELGATARRFGALGTIAVVLAAGLLWDLERIVSREDALIAAVQELVHETQELRREVRAHDMGGAERVGEIVAHLSAVCYVVADGDDELQRHCRGAAGD